jgi:threonine aldolase
MKVHMDGARVFNAATLWAFRCGDRGAGGYGDVLPVEGAGRAGGFDAGRPAELIAKGRLYRKRLGGGMRQAGVLAAAGLIALEETPARLDRGSRQRAVPRGRSGAHSRHCMDPRKVATNIVVFDIGATGLTTSELSRRLKQRGVLINGISQNLMRAVTHYDVTRAECAQARKPWPESR